MNGKRVEAATDVLMDHGHNGIECRPEPGFDKHVAEALAAADAADDHVCVPVKELEHLLGLIPTSSSAARVVCEWFIKGRPDPLANDLS